MKLVNRYHLWASLECQHFSKAEAVLKFSAEEDGMWVQWQDYASLKEEVDALKLGSLLTAVDVLQFIKLKEENERLRASSFVTAVPVEEYEKLKAENERLRQDLVAVKYYGELLEFLKANAAKEGKQP